MQLNVQGIDIFLKDEGSGTPVLLLHGNPDSADVWDGITSRLCGSYRCLAPDLPGFGRSADAKDFDCSLDNLARFVDELVEAIGITEPLNLIVHDVGGIFGLAWLVKHPDKVHRLVIMNTIFSSDYRWHIWAKLWRTPLVGELSMLALVWPVFRWSLKLGSRNLTEEQMRGAFKFLTPSMKRMVLRFYRATNPRNFERWEDQLKQITARLPTIVLWGDHDPYIPPRYADRFGTERIEHFSDFGHWLQAEAPDQVANQLMQFFDEEDA
jgi:pimeloyl-ACP methyl ester carboxylesterase